MVRQKTEEGRKAQFSKRFDNKNKDDNVSLNLNNPNKV